MVSTRLGHGKERLRSGGYGKQKRISLLFGNQKVNLRPVSADKEEWVSADHEETDSEDLCFLTETTPEEVIDHLKSCGVAIEEGPVNKQGAIGSGRWNGASAIVSCSAHWEASRQ